MADTIDKSITSLLLELSKSVELLLEREMRAETDRVLAGELGDRYGALYTARTELESLSRP